MTKFQTGKSLEVAIKIDHLGLVFDGQCGQMRIAGQVAGSACSQQKTGKNIRVARARVQDVAVGVTQPIIHNTTRISDRQGFVQEALLSG